MRSSVFITVHADSTTLNQKLWAWCRNYWE